MTVIALWRPLSARPSPARARRAATRGRRAATRAPARSNVTWELRSFTATAGAIVVGFVLALLYLGSSMGVSTLGYETQQLQEQRDELRRRSGLLEVQLAKLGSPARIQTEARRLGLVHLSFVPVVPAASLAARR